MVRYVPDRTGRFPQRPHYEPQELDRDCEALIVSFLRELYGEARFPVRTDDLTKLIERETDDLDLYASPQELGAGVEGVTEFRRGRKPSVKINVWLYDDERRENRLRTTLTHEYGHVHYHGYLFGMDASPLDLFARNAKPERIVCKRETIIEARQTDWMEWQAGYVSGALLMPRSEVGKIVSGYNESNNVFGPVRPEGRHGRNLIGLLTEAFAVSQDAARVRLSVFGFIGAQESAASLFSSR